MKDIFQWLIFAINEEIQVIKWFNNNKPLDFKTLSENAKNNDWIDNKKLNQKNYKVNIQKIDETIENCKENYEILLKNPSTQEDQKDKIKKQMQTTTTAVENLKFLYSLKYLEESTDNIAISYNMLWNISKIIEFYYDSHIK